MIKENSETIMADTNDGSFWGEFLPSLGIQLIAILIMGVIVFVFVKLIFKALKTANSSAEKKKSKNAIKEHKEYDLVWLALVNNNEIDNFKNFKTYEERIELISKYYELESDLDNDEKRRALALIYLYLLENYIEIDLVDPNKSINETIKDYEIDEEHKKIALEFWDSLTYEERSRYKIITDDSKRREWLKKFGRKEEWLDAALINYVEELDSQWLAQMGQMMEQKKTE